MKYVGGRSIWGLEWSESPRWILHVLHSKAVISNSFAPGLSGSVATKA